MEIVTPASVVAVVGLLLYVHNVFTVERPKIAEIGRIMFWVGLFVALFQAGK